MGANVKCVYYNVEAFKSMDGAKSKGSMLSVSMYTRLYDIHKFEKCGRLWEVCLKKCTVFTSVVECWQDRGYLSW